MNQIEQVQMQQQTLTPMVMTTGEPAGIGMDILLQLAISGKLSQLNRHIMVLADEEALIKRGTEIYGLTFQQQYPKLWKRLPKVEEAILQSVSNEEIASESLQHMDLIYDRKQDTETVFYLINVSCKHPVIAGKLDVTNAQMVMTQLELAHKLAYSGYAAAIVTGPLQKSVLIDAGITLADGSMFTGHTEFFMQKSHCDKVVMMLANRAMKVALVTTHLPLREVADAITKENVRQTVSIVLNDLRQKFALNQPRVLVCGLNPHAGEGGHLGREEIEIIDPVLKEFQQQGFNISLSMPADTLFTSRHLQQCDAVIAMYHDQGLPVLKSHGFGDTVNLTLGLPYIRTSVDHGTALDLAGKSMTENSGPNASSSSLWQALLMADTMSARAL